MLNDTVPTAPPDVTKDDPIHVATDGGNGVVGVHEVDLQEEEAVDVGGARGYQRCYYYYCSSS